VRPSLQLLFFPTKTKLSVVYQIEEFGEVLTDKVLTFLSP